MGLVVLLKRGNDMLKKCKCGFDAEFISFDDYENIETYVSVQCKNDDCEETTDFYNICNDGWIKAEKEWNDNH